MTTAMKGNIDATLAVSNMAATRLTITTNGKPRLLAGGKIRYSRVNGSNTPDTMFTL
jgi:hypothetical protein